MQEPELKPKDDVVVDFLRSIHIDEEIKSYFANIVKGYDELIIQLSKPLWKESNIRNIYMLHGKREVIQKLQTTAKYLCQKKKKKLKPEA